MRYYTYIPVLTTITGVSELMYSLRLEFYNSRLEFPIQF